MNTSSNINTKKKLKTYLDMETLPFAILLKGEWGCGKTYFIKDFLKERARADEIICYVSLFGITDPKDMHKSISSKILLSTSQNVVNVSNIACNILSNISFKGLKISASNILDKVQEYIFKKLRRKKIIYIFDDLERCSIEKNILLGIINSYVDDDNSKVIIIANEETIKDEKDNDFSYIKTKEKVVGLTLKIIPDFYSVFDIIVKATSKDDMSYAALFENKKAIIELLHIGDVKNLRMLEKISFEFLSIYKSLNTYIQQDQVFIRELIYVLSAYSIFVHSGVSIDKISEYSPFESLNDEKGKTRLRLATTQTSIPESFWIDFYSNNDTENVINDHYDRLKSKPTLDAPLRLWHFFEMSDEVEFQEALEEVNAGIKDKIYTIPGLALMAFSVKLALSHEKLIDETPDDILSTAYNYLDTVSFSDEDWVTCIDSMHLGIDNALCSYSGLGFHCSKTSEFKAIIEFFLKKRENILKSVLPQMLYTSAEISRSAKDFLDSLQIIWGTRHRISLWTESIRTDIISQKIYSMESRKMIVATQFLLEHLCQYFPRGWWEKEASPEKQWISDFKESFSKLGATEQGKIKKFQCHQAIEAIDRVLATGVADR